MFLPCSLNVSRVAFHNSDLAFLDLLGHRTDRRNFGILDINEERHFLKRRSLGLNKEEIDNHKLDCDPADVEELLWSAKSLLC